MFRAQNAAANIFIGVSIGTHDPGHSDRLWRRRPKEIVISRLLRSPQNSRRMLSVGRRTAGVDHVKLRELLLVTSRTCDLLPLVNERSIANALIDRRRGTRSRLAVIFAPVKAAGNELVGVVIALRSAALARSLFLKDEGAFFGTNEVVPFHESIHHFLIGSSSLVPLFPCSLGPLFPCSLGPCLTDAVRSRC
jgi:hypothetical protein